METEKNSIQVKAEQNNKNAKNDNWKVGVSMAAGAAIGSSATAMAQDKIEETPDTPQPEPEPEPTITPEPEPIPEPEPEPFPDPEPIPEPMPEPEPEPIPEPEPEPRPEGVFRTLSYDTITVEDGSLADVAIVEIAGETGALVDNDRDGIADSFMIDLNGNGIIDQDEISDVEHMQISMAELENQLAQPESPIITDNGDYNNHGDINGYMA